VRSSLDEGTTAQQMGNNQRFNWYQNPF